MNADTLTTPLEEAPIGQIAVNLPGATAIFRRLKLDFCCGGQVSLKDACSQRHLDTSAVLGELAGLQHEPAQPDAQDPVALVDHILRRYHAVHREQLPELVRMARRVEAVHRDHPDVPVGLANHLEAMEMDLLDHMAKEEMVLFPALKSGALGVGAPIATMRHEHNGHAVHLSRLVELTHEHKPPAGACNTWRALYAGTAQLAEDLINHIHLENNVLFPQFESVRRRLRIRGE